MDRVIFAALALAVPAAAQAQTVTMDQGVLPVQRIEAPISAGTPVTLRAIATAPMLRIGSEVPFELVKPIVVDGRTIVPAGASATAVVSTIEAATKNRPGRVTGRLQTLRYGGTTVRLIGGFEGTGTNEPTVPMGLLINGYVDEDVAAYAPPAPRPVLSAPVIVADTGTTMPMPKPMERPSRPTFELDMDDVRPHPTARPTKRPSVDSVVTTRTTRVTATTVMPAPGRDKPVYGDMRSLTTQTSRVPVKKPQTVLTRVTPRDVTVDSGGTTTHYVY
jgi:hypothetical protein